MLVATSIAIDGPVASGKTSVGRRLAQVLRYDFLDTGLMYRAVTLSACQRNLDLDCEGALTRVAESLQIEVFSELDTGIDRVEVDKMDVTDLLRTAEVEQKVSLVSSYPRLRAILVAKQRHLADNRNIVMVGRDIGTVVLPKADLKIFLLASAEERARRLYQQTHYRGGSLFESTIRLRMDRRDTLDKERLVSPLNQASDAHPVSTEDTDVEGVVHRILRLLPPDNVT